MLEKYILPSTQKSIEQPNKRKREYDDDHSLGEPSNKNPRRKEALRFSSLNSATFTRQVRESIASMTSWAFGGPQPMESIEKGDRPQETALNIGDSKKAVLPLGVLFRAMMSIDGSREYFLGSDNWREPIMRSRRRQADALSSFDPALATEVSREPKSKGGKWNTPAERNLWSAVHAGLLLPSVQRVLKRYGEAKLSLPYPKAKEFFSVLPYAINHCKEYGELAGEYNYPDNEQQVKEEWDERLNNHLNEIDARSPIKEILSNLPDNLRTKAETALRHHNDPKAENDSLVGRMILAYLATKGVPWEKLGIDSRIEGYLRPMRSAPQDYQTKSLYERLLHVHVRKIPQLVKLVEDVPDLNYKNDTPIPLSKFSQIYRWYGTPDVVEMVKPDLVGAAQLGFSELSALFEHMEKTEGSNYHDDSEMSTKSFRDTQSPEKVGRFALVQDIIESTYESEQRGGKPLRELAGRIWNEDERQEAWGNTARYVPDSRRDFSTFKQDIGNILYSAGLFEERQGDKSLAADLKLLANQTKTSPDNLEDLGQVIRKYQGKVNRLVARWQMSYPEHERTRIAQFLQQTFALEPVKPVPVGWDAISGGFKGSEYRPSEGTYHIKYSEAGKTKQFDIPLLKIPAQTKYTFVDMSSAFVDMSSAFSGWWDRPFQTASTVIYHSEMESNAPFLEITRDNGDRVHIPVPGRGSYDPFGTTGSPHAGEVVEYGCSVHHARLAVMLTELAARGAGLDTLKNFKDNFMQISPDKHHRQDMANFQVDQVWTAFNEGRELSFSEYIHKNSELQAKLVAEPGHEHTIQYLMDPEKEPLAASATRARLAYG